MTSQFGVQLGILLLLRLALGLVLLSSAVAKLFDLERFVKDVTAYEVFPPLAARAVGVGLPWLELTLGFALSIGIMIPSVGLLAGLLFSAFAFGVAVNLRRGRHIACGCRGIVGSPRIGWGVVTRNCLLSVASFTAVGIAVSRVGIDLRPTLAPDWAVLSSPAEILMLALAMACSLALLHLLGSAIDAHSRIAQLGAELYRQQVGTPFDQRPMNSGVYAKRSTFEARNALIDQPPVISSGGRRQA